MYLIHVSEDHQKFQVAVVVVVAAVAVVAVAVVAVVAVVFEHADVLVGVDDVVDVVGDVGYVAADGCNSTFAVALSMDDIVAGGKHVFVQITMKL